MSFQGAFSVIYLFYNIRDMFSLMPVMKTKQQICLSVSYSFHSSFNGVSFSMLTFHYRQCVVMLYGSQYDHHHSHHTSQPILMNDITFEKLQFYLQMEHTEWDPTYTWFKRCQHHLAPNTPTCVTKSYVWLFYKNWTSDDAL